MVPLTIDLIPAPPEGMHRVYSASGKWIDTLKSGDSRLEQYQRIGYIVW